MVCVFTACIFQFFSLPECIQYFSETPWWLILIHYSIIFIIIIILKFMNGLVLMYCSDYAAVKVKGMKVDSKDD